jgi:hypothetical protein
LIDEVTFLPVELELLDADPSGLSAAESAAPS